MRNNMTIFFSTEAIWKAPRDINLQVQKSKYCKYTSVADRLLPSFGYANYQYGNSKTF